MHRIIWDHARKLKFGLDLSLWLVTIPLAFYIRLGPAPSRSAVALMMMVALPLFALVIYHAGLHRQSWGVVGGRDLERLVTAIAVGSTILFLEAWFLQRWSAVPRSAPLISAGLSVLLLGGTRLAARWWNERLRLRPQAHPERRVLIIGAGEAGTMLVRDILRHPESGIVPVGFLDDDPSKRQLFRMGIPVIGPLDDLPTAFRTAQAHEALLAIPSATLPLRRRLFDLAAREQIPLRAVPSIYDLLASRTPAQIRDVMNELLVDGMGRNILIIGGAGYIGSALVPQLLARGYNVRLLDLLIYGDEPIRPFLDHARFSLIQGDFRQVDKVVESLQGIDTVVHLGGLVGDPACALDEELTVEINLMATKMIAEVAKGYGVRRFVFASTCSVYGEKAGILDEESPLNPVSLYARTKIASEKVLLKLQDARFSPTILRFGTVYGFSGRTRFDLVVNLLTAKAVTEGSMTLYGGDQWRPFVHVHDVASAILSTLEAPATKTSGRTFNVGSDDQNHTLASMAQLVADYVPGAVILDKGANADRRNYRVSFARIHDELGFKAHWTLEAGIRQVADAIRTGAVDDYRTPIYSNVQYLTNTGLAKLVRREFGAPLVALEETVGR